MTIQKFLAGSIKENGLSFILGDNSLRDIDIELFFQKFGQMSQEEMISFLKDSENAYAIGVFGYNHNYHNKYPEKKEFYYDKHEQMY